MWTIMWTIMWTGISWLCLHISITSAMKVYNFEGTLKSASKEMSFATLTSKTEENLPHK